jgi:hypothetical protein
MENKYFYMLYNLVIRLQTNLLFNTDENLMNNKSSTHHISDCFGKYDISWRPKEDKLIDLCQANLSPILSDCFLSKKDNKDETHVFASSVKSATHQLLNLIKKFELTSYCLDEINPPELEKIKSMFKKLQDFKGIVEQFGLRLGCFEQSRIDQLENDFPTLSGKHKSNYQNTIERILQTIETICDSMKFNFNVADFRRVSIHSDQCHLDMLSILTKHSKKYNPEGADSSECYYKSILDGKVEMEIDSKELNMGLARSFIKIFNKMLLNQPNYKRRFRKICASIDSQVHKTFPFLFESELQSLEETIQKLENEKKELEQERITLEKSGQRTANWDDKISRIEVSLMRLEEKLRVLRIPIDNTYQFLFAYETNFFYNSVYSKAIILYEKLIDKIPELKAKIYNESIKNKGLINFETNEHNRFERTYPYLHNIYTLSLQYTYHLTTCVVYNSKWGVSYSNLFIVLSVLSNLTLDNYHSFKTLFAEVKFEDPLLELFKEIEDDKEKSGKAQTLEKAPGAGQKGGTAKGSSHKGETKYEKEVFKPLPNDSKQYEDDKQSFLVSICCRLERFLHFYEFYDNSRLNSNFDSKVNTTALPILTIWLNFIDVVLLSDDSEANVTALRRSTSYVYHKIVSRYLLRMLFAHDDISNNDVMYLKKAICSLLFKLVRNEDVMDNLLKYHFDLRTIYDYTIKITKVHIASLISNNPAKKMFKWLQLAKKKTEKHLEITADSNVNKLIQSIAFGFKDLALKVRKTKFSFNAITSEPSKDEKDRELLIQCNTNLFGGFNFSTIKDRDHQKELEKLVDLSGNEIMECYKKSDNRDLGFQFINSLVKLMGFIEYSTGLKLWSSKKETARVQFEVEPAKLPKIKLYELSIVYFLSMINKQIEVVDQNGKNVLINFRKYPEIYTLESLNPLELIGEFKFEDFKRDVCKIIPELYVKTNIQYNIQQKMGFWYMLLKSDSTKKHPVILWLFSVVLNFIIFTGYENLEYRDYTHKLRSSNYKLAETIMAILIMIYSLLTTSFWLSARYYAIRSNKTKMHNISELSSSKNGETRNLMELRGIFSFITDNPYFRFIFDMIFTMDTFSTQ